MTLWRHGGLSFLGNLVIKLRSFGISRLPLPQLKRLGASQASSYAFNVLSELVCDNGSLLCSQNLVMIGTHTILSARQWQRMGVESETASQKIAGTSPKTSRFESEKTGPESENAALRVRKLAADFSGGFREISSSTICWLFWLLDSSSWLRQVFTQTTLRTSS